MHRCTFTALALVAALALSGCPTVPPDAGRVQPVPPARLVDAALGEGARLRVVMDVGLMTRGCFTALYVNGRLVARMDAGESVLLDVAPGQVIVAPGRDPEGKALCAIGRGHAVPREFAVAPGAVRALRIAVGPGGLDVYPLP